MRRLKSFFATLAGLLLALAALPASAALLASDKAVLEALYTSTNGAGWTRNDNWLVGDPCADNWYGITCDAGGTRVTSITLTFNNLNGVLPSTLNQLTDLKNLWVQSNQLGGSIPSLSGLTKLQEIRVTSNQLTGSIPGLSGLNDLRYFNLADNQLTGPMPNLAGLNLWSFDVSNNQLYGPMPDLAGLNGLIYFNVSNNRLYGPLPGSITDLDRLDSFLIQGNQFTGTPPAAPPNLLSDESRLCPNFLHAPSPSDAAWDQATSSIVAVQPWSRDCTAGWLVTVVASAGGSAGGTHAVADGATTAMAVTPNPGYVASVAGTCGGLLSDGGLYTTAPVTQDCTVEVSFTRQDGPHPGDRVTAVPTLGEWGLLLLATLLGALGLRHARTRGR